MLSTDAIILLLSTACFGALGWSFQLQSRMSVVETEYDGLKDLINERFGEVNRRLQRIENSVSGTFE